MNDEGVRPLLRARKTGTALAEGLRGQYSYWWDVGRLMVEHNLSAPSAREAIEVAGFVLEKSNRTLRRMRKVYERLREAGATRKNARGCPMRFAKACVDFWEGGTLSTREMNAALKCRTRRLGEATGVYAQLKEDPQAFAKQALSDE